jgi:integrase
MALLDLPYLWPAKGRGGRLYWFYRRNGQNVPIKSPDGKRLWPEDGGFLEAYERIHASFSGADRPPPNAGTMAHLIDLYRDDVEFTERAPSTKKNYARWLDWLKKDHGTRLLADFPREAVAKMRKDRKDTPAAANYLMSVVSVLLNYAEEHPLALRLPKGWRNPARGMKRLEEGDGHVPWEEDDIDAFRERWDFDTIERVYFETFLNTGQRGIDVAAMDRNHYRRGEIHVVQEKTGARVWIPASDDLAPVLDLWLGSHNAPVFFPNPHGTAIHPNYMRNKMRDAMTAAGLPETHTLHGLRYTFATRSIELGLEYDTIEAIVGHETMEMAIKYTSKRRRSRLTINTLNEGVRRRREQLQH